MGFNSKFFRIKSSYYKERDIIFDFGRAKSFLLIFRSQNILSRLFSRIHLTSLRTLCAQLSYLMLHLEIKT
ncbi:unnamed protein product [Moneuplotes crassus]|uniref:Uncharacterized protein n=1 Tax=Euplotes crassus TaxID=5936 RepID=A0AAD1XEG6_EUPCR|nr:unnamed protein product [Moneuplotes crassus]